MTLDEREAIAKAATAGEWTFREGDSEVAGDGEPACQYEGAFIDEIFTIDCGEYHGLNNADARYIAAWNPARALKAIALLREAQELLNDAACDCFPEGNRHYSDCAVLLHRKWLADLAAFEKE